MADDFGFQPVQHDDGIGFQPIPKAPDTSGVQKMAGDNLAANDNKETPESAVKEVQTPQQRLDTAVGMPVSSLLNPDDTTPIPAPVRKQYTKAIQNGDASSFGDFAQTMLHTIVPIAAGIIQPQRQAQKLERVAEEAQSGVSEGAASGTLFPTDTMFGQTANLPFQVMGAGFSAFQRGTVQAGVETGLPQTGKELALLPEEMMGAEGIFPHLPKAPTRLAGPWDNLPGKDALDMQKIVGKPTDAVSSSDFDQTIAQGTNHKTPTPQDFKAVETVTNGALPEKTLHIVFNETGVKPDQVFNDAQHDPTIAADVAAGKVPEAYEHLVEEKPVLPPSEAEKLTVAPDEATRSFTVTDKEGDHVSGGFDSAEEARHYIEDEKFKAEERAAIEEEAKVEIPTGKGFAGENSEAPITTAANKNTRVLTKDNAHEFLASAQDNMADVKMLEVSKDAPMFNREEKAIQDVQGRKISNSNVITPSEIGRPTSLRTFLSNNGAKFNEANELVSIKKNGQIIRGAQALEYAHQISQEHGYLPKNEASKPSAPITDFKNILTEKNGGREAFRDQDADRVLKAKEAAEARANSDPSEIENEAHNVGIDTERLKGETDKQYTARLLKALQDFYKSEQGSGLTFRNILGKAIVAAEKFAGKLGGSFFQKLADGYIKTFQPELTGSLAKRADAYMAKYKAARQEAENSYYKQSAISKKMFDRMTTNERLQWIYDHETGRWNEEDDADHARFQALFDATFEAEKEAIGADAEKGYKENYLPHQWENPEAVAKFFRSDAMIKKYGADWFTKASMFKLIQEGIRADFKLKTDNPESMLTARLLAGHNMIATMDLLHDMEGSGIAKKATVFGIDKKIAKTEAAIKELQDKYKKEFEKKNNPNQPTLIEGLPPAESKVMQVVEKRLDDLKQRLDNFNKEKAENNSTPEQMKELKGGLRVIGPDSKVWNIHPQAIPLWKNAMEMKGLWENQGVIGDVYRAYNQGKNIWTAVKLGLSLFHPVHVAMIDLASDIAKAAEHLIQGGKFSDAAIKPNIGLTKETFKGQDHPAIQAWQTAPELRTPQQKQMVARMIEGGFKPTMSARDTVHFRENFDKAINGVGVNNLRLLGTAVQLPGAMMKPFFEHWIPGMKAEVYLQRTEAALKRDPSLLTDAGKRGEVFRQIAKDTDRTYGEMNQDVQFWNKNVKDSFNAAFISGGWKLAQIYNAKGLLQAGNIAYKFAKTGEFNKADITFNMLHAYAYTGLTLALGGAINTMLGNPIGTAKETVWDIIKNLVAPKTGDYNPDGTPIRLNQPAFAKEAYNVAHEINTKGLIGGTGSFLYHQTLIPGIAETLGAAGDGLSDLITMKPEPIGKDHFGRTLISNPTDLHQWMNAGWDSIMPISWSNAEKAESKQSKIGKIAGIAGFPLAGAYINQTPFEQKVIYAYDQHNPPTGDVYQQKLKADLKSAVISGNAKAAEETRLEMKKEGMTDTQIHNAEKIYTKSFAEDAWKKLPLADQKRLIESASDEEKKKFKIKSE